MSDEKKDDPGHEGRVHAAFDSLHESLGPRVGPDERETLERVREAALRRDAGSVRDGLSAVRERHGWLWEEMAKHPQLASLIDELSLWGF
jgi:hypothetical protein